MSKKVDFLYETTGTITLSLKRKTHRNEKAIAPLFRTC